MLLRFKPPYFFTIVMIAQYLLSFQISRLMLSQRYMYVGTVNGKGCSKLGTSILEC
jgi:hypothetical protein